MPKYICNVCEYVYDPSLGDPDSGIEPGLPLEALPEHWVCPECGADKTNFDLLDGPKPPLLIRT